MKIALVGVAVALSSSPAGAECVAYGLLPKIATPASTVLPVDGGIVVYAEAHQNGISTPGDPVMQIKWSWRGAGPKPTPATPATPVPATPATPVPATPATPVPATPATPVIVSLAPGLAVVKSPGVAANVELVDGGGRSLIAARATTARRKLLDAPKLLSAVFEERGTRRHYEQVTLELAVAAPAGVLAIVVLDDKGARSWQLVTPSSTTVAGYSQGGCIPLPNGTRPSKAGDTVRVAFVDDGGRMSAPSAPIKISKKR